MGQRQPGGYLRFEKYLSGNKIRGYKSVSINVYVFGWGLHWDLLKREIAAGTMSGIT